MSNHDIDIARRAHMLPIGEVGARVGIPADALLQYGHTKAKIRREFLEAPSGGQEGKLILVTAITPTPAGEGKTTAAVGIADGLNRIGRKAVVCLREPSLGPCFGMKGGAAGGGRAQVMPMEEINLHFTGDFHAIGAANNLLAALVDNHIHHGNAFEIDTRRISWRRVVDMNDRSLRGIVTGLGGRGNGYPQESGFDITVASEVMAIFCLATDLRDLERRLGRIVIGHDRKGAPVTAEQLQAPGAMTVLLKDALQPNLVQTLENNPALIHGGPFANIAHGCSSVIATRAGLRLADYVITEAGFGADLGAEKFFNIKCRKAGLRPAAAVLVATVRALKMHGGVEIADLSGENVEAVVSGCANLERHLRNVQSFGVPVVIAINQFEDDTDAELAAVSATASRHGVRSIVCSHWRDGGAGAEAIAGHLVELCDRETPPPAFTYPDDLPLERKIECIAREIYGAAGIAIDERLKGRLRALQETHGTLPICMAKTQYSFSNDPLVKGAASGHTISIREVRLSAGAGFIVVVCGDITTMPGLPKAPAAHSIRLNGEGDIVGLF